MPSNKTAHNLLLPFASPETVRVRPAGTDENCNSFTLSLRMKKRNNPTFNLPAFNYFFLFIYFFSENWRQWDSIPALLDYGANALPTELRRSAENSSGWFHGLAHEQKKKKSFFFPSLAWMTVDFLWWLESSYGLSRRFCYGALLFIGRAVLGKKRFLVSTFFDWHFLCQVKLFFRQRKSR